MIGKSLHNKVEGKDISPEIVQINLKVLKQGEKKLEEVFKKEEVSEKKAE